MPTETHLSSTLAFRVSACPLSARCSLCVAALSRLARRCAGARQPARAVLQQAEQGARGERAALRQEEGLPPGRLGRPLQPGPLLWGGRAADARHDAP
eukprot:5115653-Pyramimonas_sp.AAC.1